MKTAKIITIVCWLVTALILIGLAIWLFTGNLFGFNTGFKIGGPVIHIGGSFDNLTGPFNEVGAYSIPVDDISSIRVNWTSGNISVTPYDGDTIKLTEYARRDLEDKEKLIYDVNGGNLEVHYISPSLRINMISKKIEVLVPRTLAGQLDTLAVDSASADLQLSGFDVTTLDIGETSGTTELSDITAEQADLHSVSGSINVSGLSTSRLTLGTVSGGIRLSDVVADTLKTNTTSGGQYMAGTFKDVDAGSVSGAIELISSVNPDKIRCGTTSGGIRVTLPGNTNLDVSYSTVSGRFTSEVPVTNSGGGAPYSFSSVSGSITIKKAA